MTFEPIPPAIAVAAISIGIWFCSNEALADSVPSWDVTASCRGAAEAGFTRDTGDNLHPQPPVVGILITSGRPKRCKLANNPRLRQAKHRDPGEPVVFERSDGTWHQISEKKTRDGGVVVVYSDITDIKRHEAELEVTNQRFRDVAEVSADWLYEMDEDLRFTYISDRAAPTPTRIAAST